MAYRKFDGTNFTKEATCKTKRRANEVASHLRQGGERKARIIKTGNRYAVFRESKKKVGYER